jgi:preprotein translocase subunit YajC
MFATPAFAQTAGAAGAQPGGMAAFLSSPIPMMVVVFVFFFFLVIRPQQQKAKQHRATLDAVKKGDEVVTGGGILGKATKVDDDGVEVEIAPGVKVRALKATLLEVRPSGSGKPAND